MKAFELLIDYNNQQGYRHISFRAPSILAAIKFVEKHIINNKYDKNIYLYKLITEEGEINFRALTPDKRYVVEVKTEEF